MSIFKETFKDFVFKQLRIREAIIEQGNNPTKFRHRFGRPRVEIQGEDGSSTKINIAAGAFYTNTVNKQCVIRMASGVNVISNEFLEEGEDGRDERLAKNYILEGGVLGPDNKPREGFTTSNRNSNPAYGDPTIRSDAKDGFGIVPMPGIVDADIRTKTAYGSLREAKVNFVCHNKRQLEVLELLYMRPGFPILLEWQWSPFINNEGKIDSTRYGIENDWFDETKTINELNSSILQNIKDSSGNYDGFIGFCKNFEFTSRPDGGYNCTTEIIAMGEVLEGLKSRNDGFYKTVEEKQVQIDNMMFLLEGILGISTLKSKLNLGNGSSALDFLNRNDLINNFLVNSENVDALSKLRELNESNNPGNSQVAPLRQAYNYTKSSDLLREYFDKVDKYFIFKSDKLGSRRVFFNLISKTNKSSKTYIRWDHFCDMINRVVFPLANPDKPDDPLVQLTYTQTNNKDKEEYLRYVLYKFPSEKYSKVDNRNKRVRDIKINEIKNDLEKQLEVEDILNNSFDPTICLLPPQNSKSEDTGEPLNEIGKIMLNADHLLKVYEQMAYSNDEPKENFNLFDYFKRIWEDVNKACVGNHNFILQTELNSPNKVRVIDLQVDPPNIKPEDLFEFKIQSNKSIVRDFNFNTTIPSSLTATIGIAAQAPTSVSDLDQVTFRNFSKGIKSRFTTNIEITKTKTSDGKNKDALGAYRQDLENYEKNVVDLAVYQAKLLMGEFDDNEKNSIDDKTFSQATSLASSVQKQLTSLLQRDPDTGKRYPLVPSRKSAVIPLKFNAQMDGTSGIVIGNVFKVEKEKLPKGYQADDVAFTVLGESQKITAGQDWTTDINGQLMLLDLGEEERKKQLQKFTFDAEPLEFSNNIAEADNTRVANPIAPVIIEDEFTTSEDVDNDISEFFPDATVTEGDASLGNENEKEKPPNEQDKIEALRGNGTKYVGDDVSPNLQVAKGKARMNALKQLLNAAGVSNSSSVNISGFIEVDIKTTRASSGLYTVTRTYELR
jgi:hypothetical protein